MKPSPSIPTRVFGAAALLALVQDAFAHSWVEQLMRIAPNGTMVGAPGFIRGYVPRGPAPFFNDGMVDWLLPPNDGRPASNNSLLATDKLCHPSQIMSNYTAEFPKLIASPGDYIAMRYQENGHVTLPWNNPDKPLNRGTVYIYGTNQATDGMNFLDVHGQWTADGQGGDKKGRLLATRNYDDGQCYQINFQSISDQRKVEFSKEADPLQGAELWCQNDIQLPSDLEVGKDFTLFWVWAWPSMNVDNKAPTDIPGVVLEDGTVTSTKKLEYYTSCMETTIVDPCSDELEVKGPLCGNDKGTGGSKSAVSFFNTFAKGQSLNDAAIMDQLTIGNFQVDVGRGKVNQPGASSPAASETSSPTASEASTGCVPAATNGQSGMKTVYITETVAITTVTVTAGVSAPTAGQPPVVSPFTTANARQVRRGAGEWAFRR